MSSTSEQPKKRIVITIEGEAGIFGVDGHLQEIYSVSSRKYRSRVVSTECVVYNGELEQLQKTGAGAGGPAREQTDRCPVCGAPPLHTGNGMCKNYHVMHQPPTTNVLEELESLKQWACANQESVAVWNDGCPFVWWYCLNAELNKRISVLRHQKHSLYHADQEC